MSESHYHSHKNEAHISDTNVIKALLLGDSNVGKSTFLMRSMMGDAGGLLDDDNENVKPTVGIDFRSVLVEIEGELYNLQLWDTAGQERYHSITKAYYRVADVVLLFFDITNKDSIHSCGKWLNQIATHCPSDCFVQVVGNKTDLVETHSQRDEAAAYLLDSLRNLGTSNSAMKVSPTAKYISARSGEGVVDLLVFAVSEYARLKLGGGVFKNQKSSAVNKADLFTTNKSVFTRCCF